MEIQKLENVDLKKYTLQQIPQLLASSYEAHGMNADAESMYLNALLNDSKNYKLKQACEKNKNSLAIALLQAATFGLSANPYTRHYSLVPYGDVVTLMPEYRGEIHILKRDFGLLHYEIGIVVEGEQFEIIDGKIIHKKTHFRKITDKNIVGGYATALLKDGQKIYLEINKDDILQCRDVASTKNVWNKWFEKMVNKTIVHQLFDEVVKHSNPSPEAMENIFKLREFDNQFADFQEIKEEEKSLPSLNNPATAHKDNIEKQVFDESHKDWLNAVEKISTLEDTAPAIEALKNKYIFTKESEDLLLSQAIEFELSKKDSNE